MFQKRGFLALLVVAMSAIFFYTFNSENAKTAAPPSLSYISRLDIERKNKNEYLKTNTESPIEKKADFKGLNYYKVDEGFKIIAKIDLNKNFGTELIKTSGEEIDTMKVFGKATFEFQGKQNSLTIYQTANNRILFLPFQDLTNNNETYGGGRYLDIPITDLAGDKMVIDFNLAYHPYCAYNHTYICPIPPKQNKMDIAIKAGEKL